MPDYIDHSAEMQEQVLENSINAIVNRRVGDSLPECIDCGQPIPAERRLKVPGCQRCIDCQATHELKQQHYRSV